MSIQTKRRGTIASNRRRSAAGFVRTVPLVGKSAMAWNSLAFSQSGTANPTTFPTWRDRDLDGVVYWPARATWTDMRTLPGNRRANDLIVFGIPFWPEGIGGSFAAINAGTYDSEITTWANALIAAGWNNSRTAIRLAWEGNVSSNQWAWTNTNVADWIAAYQRWVTVCNAAGLTAINWAWSCNKGPGSGNSTTAWTSVYPGDAYVDIIGIDAYDMWTPTTSQAQWDANIAPTGGTTGAGKNPGLQGIVNFARAHNKMWSIDEWGVLRLVSNPSDPNHGGDNPYYIAKIFDFCQANSVDLAWESYFDHTSGFYDIQISDGTYPDAAAQYLTAYPAGWGTVAPATAPSVRGSAATYGSTGSEASSTVPLPSGWQIGDILYIGWELTASTGTITVPAGWVQAVPQFTNAASMNSIHGVLRRVAQSGDTAPAITHTSGRFAGVSVAIQGANTTTPEDVTPTTDNNFSGAAYPNVNAPSISPTTANCLLLTWHTVRNATSAATTTFTPPSGMTERGDVTSTDAAFSNAAVELATLTLGAVGATGVKTATASSTSGTSISQAGSAIAVRPA